MTQDHEPDERLTDQLKAAGRNSITPEGVATAVQDVLAMYGDGRTSYAQAYAIAYCEWVRVRVAS